MTTTAARGSGLPRKQNTARGPTRDRAEDLSFLAQHEMRIYGGSAFVKLSVNDVILRAMYGTERIARELATADAARSRGNEGMARVCARRAAGWAAEAYLQARGQGIADPSVLVQLRQLAKQPGVSLRVHEIIAHLLMPKLKDDVESDSYFPETIDLVAEARELIEELSTLG
jgi:hypothetical protein